MQISRNQRLSLLLLFSGGIALPNGIAALFTTLLNRFFIFDQYAISEIRFQQSIFIINSAAFGLATLLFITLFWPIVRQTTPLERLRRLILNAPALIALITLGGWITAAITNFSLLPDDSTDIGWLDVVGSMLAILSIGALAIALAYFYQDTLNRRYLIPTYFDNQLDGYAAHFQPTIRARFLIYFGSVTVAPLLFVCWALIWSHNQQIVFNLEQLTYIAAYLLFALLFGLIVTFSFANTFHQPLIAAVAVTDEIRHGNFHTQLAVSATDEVGRLCERINQMSATLASDREEIMQLNHEIEATQREVVFTMGAIGESRSKETGNHVKRVAEYSRLLALHAGLDEREADLLRQASPMHDIGKVAIPDAILNKPARLTADEFSQMKHHARLGYEMLRHSDRPLLQAAAIVAHQHHEKWDGSGYPQGLAGDSIHIYGRITAVADVLDALGSERIYKKAWPDEEIFALFRQQAGRHFDPHLIEILFSHLDEFLAIRDTWRDEPIAEATTL
jgi:HD-GYP domain-containing protein (c-di-GMP phosphodiesterase class II)